MSTIQDEIVTGNVAKLVNRLSRDFSANRNSEINFRKSSNFAKIATVRFSYKGAHDDELDLEVDDVLEVIEDAEPGWMKGKLRSTGRVGLFPTNFVQFSEIPQNSGNGLKIGDMKKKFIENTNISSKIPEATLRTSTSELMKGRVFPGASISGKLDQENIHINFHEKNIPKNEEFDPRPQKEMARVLYTYKPCHDDELALQEVGAMVTIVSKTCADPGWYLAEIDGKEGLIPDNFVELIRPSTSITDAHRATAPPIIPVKPTKPPGLGISSTISAGRRCGGASSSAFAAMHTTLADALTKPPKAFIPKAARNEEGSIESHGNERLSHITINRPKQPNKRPPSTVFIKRKSIDSDPRLSLSQELSQETTSSVADVPSNTTALSVSAQSVGSSHMHPSSSPPKTSPCIPQAFQHAQIASILQKTPSINEVNGIGFVPRSEYNILLKEFEAYKKETTRRIESLETILSKNGLH